MNAYDSKKNNNTEYKNNISQKEIFFHIYNYTVRTDIIYKSDTRKYKNGIQKKSEELQYILDIILLSSSEV